MPNALVIRAPGTNCDLELCRAFSLAGADVNLVHLDRLLHNHTPIADADLIGLPGGFSYGDDIASGRIFALKIRERLYSPFRDAVERGVPVFAPCNGFQVAVQVGLLPGPHASEPWPPVAAPSPQLALTDNASARFVDRWVGIDFSPDSSCIWTRGILDHIPDEWRPHAAMLPVAHGEGRLIAQSPDVFKRLAQNAQIAARYTENFNGSTDSIAGICDASGRIFGLMPHPERYLDWHRHPYWTRLPKELLKTPTPGLRMFQNAVLASRSLVRT